jgi:hypothetical protein
VKVEVEVEEEATAKKYKKDPVRNAGMKENHIH